MMMTHCQPSRTSRIALQQIEAQSLSLVVDMLVKEKEKGRMVTHVSDSTKKKGVGQFIAQGRMSRSIILQRSQLLREGKIPSRVTGQQLWPRELELLWTEQTKANFARGSTEKQEMA